ncbi:MAG TPA: hypothetical protein VL981_08745 [Candidatus Methylacidiphilales bacterium]|nr:hypothetical protein [Candidatus Methylacidiphilales bacterium]
MILIFSSSFVGILLLAHVFVSWKAVSAAHELRSLEVLIKEGQESDAVWKQVALRTYQLSQQDEALKEVLKREQINITSKASSTASSASGNAAPGQ